MMFASQYGGCPSTQGGTLCVPINAGTESVHIFVPTTSVLFFINVTLESILG
jgi:hypothetical protein